MWCCCPSVKKDISAVAGPAVPKKPVTPSPRTKQLEMVQMQEDNSSPSDRVSNRTSTRDALRASDLVVSHHASSTRSSAVESASQRASDGDSVEAKVSCPDRGASGDDSVTASDALNDGDVPATDDGTSDATVIPNDAVVMAAEPEPAQDLLLSFLNPAQRGVYHAIATAELKQLYIQLLAVQDTLHPFSNTDHRSCAFTTNLGILVSNPELLSKLKPEVHEIMARFLEETLPLFIKVRSEAENQELFAAVRRLTIDLPLSQGKKPHCYKPLAGQPGAVVDFGIEHSLIELREFQKGSYLVVTDNGLSVAKQARFFMIFANHFRSQGIAKPVAARQLGNSLRWAHSQGFVARRTVGASKAFFFTQSSLTGLQSFTDTYGKNLKLIAKYDALYSNVTHPTFWNSLLYPTEAYGRGDDAAAQRRQVLRGIPLSLTGGGQLSGFRLFSEFEGKAFRAVIQHRNENNHYILVQRADEDMVVIDDLYPSCRAVEDYSTVKVVERDGKVIRNPFGIFRPDDSAESKAFTAGAGGNFILAYYADPGLRGQDVPI